MKRIDRRTFVSGLGASITLGPAAYSILSTRPALGATNPDLTKINPKLLITSKEAIDWHKVKDSKGGPTIAGSPSWRNYLEFAEKEFKAAGLTDTFKNSWKYQRWYTTEWPDDSNWSLTIDGQKMKVANYACNSGKTPDAGSTGELVIYEDGMPADALKGKIAILLKGNSKAVIETGAKPVNPEAAQASGNTPPATGDYEFLSNPDTFMNALVPRADGGGLSPFTQMGLGGAQQALIQGGALGAVMILPLSYEALAGTYTFGVPALHEMPSLYIDIETGKKVVEAAKAKKKATLKLIAKTEESETYQLFGYLPGKDYGKPEDTQVLLITHTDGPSISQENGGLGILGMVKYFSKIPQADRPRTLMVFLDCRHYMPGAERAFAANDYAASHPDLYKKVVAAMGIEHLGQIQVEEGNGKPYHKTEKMELSSVWITNNKKLIDLAIKSVKDNNLKRVQVQCPGKPGLHGGEQGPWYGLGGIARRIGVPGASTMGSMTAYWSTKARLDYLDADHFVNQIATMSQICGELMVADVSTLKSAEAAPAADGAGRGATGARGARRGGGAGGRSGARRGTPPASGSGDSNS